MWKKIPLSLFKGLELRNFRIRRDVIRATLTVTVIKKKKKKKSVFLGSYLRTTVFFYVSDYAIHRI